MDERYKAMIQNREYIAGRELESFERIATRLGVRFKGSRYPL